MHISRRTLLTSAPLAASAALLAPPALALPASRTAAIAAFQEAMQALDPSIDDWDIIERPGTTSTALIVIARRTSGRLGR